MQQNLQHLQYDLDLWNDFETKVRSILFSYFIHTYETQHEWFHFFVQKKKKNLEENEFNEMFKSVFYIKRTINIESHKCKVLEIKIF